MRLFLALVWGALWGDSLWPGNEGEPRPSLWWEIITAWRVARIMRR